MAKANREFIISLFILLGKSIAPTPTLKKRSSQYWNRKRNNNLPSYLLGLVVVATPLYAFRGTEGRRRGESRPSTFYFN